MLFSCKPLKISKLKIRVTVYRTLISILFPNADVGSDVPVTRTEVS
jgi:hypothetical protein